MELTKLISGYVFALVSGAATTFVTSRWGPEVGATVGSLIAAAGARLLHLHAPPGPPQTPPPWPPLPPT